MVVPPDSGPASAGPESQVGADGSDRSESGQEVGRSVARPADSNLASSVPLSWWYLQNFPRQAGPH